MRIDTRLKIAVALSLLFHIVMIFLILLLPHKRVEKENPIMARLITPEEMTGQRQGFGLPTKRQQSTKGRGNKEPVGSRIRGFEEHSKGGDDQAVRGKGRQKGGDKEGGEKDSESQGIDSFSSPNQPLKPLPSTPSRSGPSGGSPVLPRERLFDREVVEKLAKKEKEDIKPDRGITFDTNELRYYSYMQRLKDKIEGIWRYPPEAAERGIYGDLYIRFTIKKNGRLGDIELLRTSGYRSLDEAAMKALRDAEPFWPLPEEWKKDDLIITGHFI
ncbi:MAG: energy transducer TonB, partial [Thermodesulfovibrionales bacterium]